MARRLTPPSSVAPILARRWKPFSTLCQARGHDAKGSARWCEHEPVAEYICNMQRQRHMFKSTHIDIEQEHVVAAPFCIWPHIVSLDLSHSLVKFYLLSQATFLCCGTPETGKLGSRLILVLGHTKCGAIYGATKTYLDSQPGKKRKAGVAHMSS